MNNLYHVSKKFIMEYKLFYTNNYQIEISKNKELCLLEFSILNFKTLNISENCLTKNWINLIENYTLEELKKIGKGS